MHLSKILYLTLPSLLAVSHTTSRPSSPDSSFRVSLLTPLVSQAVDASVLPPTILDDRKESRNRTETYCPSDRATNDQWGVYSGNQENIWYLRGVKGKPVNGPGPNACGRIACSHDTAVFWCNDVSKPSTFLHETGIRVQIISWNMSDKAIPLPELVHQGTRLVPSNRRGARVAQGKCALLQRARGSQWGPAS